MRIIADLPPPLGQRLGRHGHGVEWQHRLYAA
jgi:hypothetical protein